MVYGQSTLSQSKSNQFTRDISVMEEIFQKGVNTLVLASL
jgi:hypothetical protein